jgi:hypothetical protein
VKVELARQIVDEISRHFATDYCARHLSQALEQIGSMLQEEEDEAESPSLKEEEAESPSLQDYLPVSIICDSANLCIIVCVIKFVAHAQSGQRRSVRFHSNVTKAEAEHEHNGPSMAQTPETDRLNTLKRDVQEEVVNLNKVSLHAHLIRCFSLCVYEYYMCLYVYYHILVSAVTIFQIIADIKELQDLHLPLQEAGLREEIEAFGNCTAVFEKADRVNNPKQIMVGVLKEFFFLASLV